MGRKQGSKFLFPLPRRKSHSKAQKDSDDTSSIPSVPELIASHYDDSSNISKAERILGTGGIPYRHSNRHSSIPQSPGHMTVTVSEASYGSEFDDRTSSTAVDDGNCPPPMRPMLSHRPSSNILGHTYNGDGRRGSNGSSIISRRLHPTNSNNTMRSHYDAKSSPLSISQQTSDSAVRDMALRKGMPQVTPSPDDEDGQADSYGAHGYPEDRRQNRKSKPPRLDLSKLFPKPKSNDALNQSTALLSPTKMVNSPVAMSINSDYFPRPMAREPTPNPKTQAKLTKSSKLSKRPQSTAAHFQVPTSPVRMYKRDMYDNAKVNVRRPPRGIQHWFDGLDDDSEEDVQEPQRAIHAPKSAVHPLHPMSKPQVPVRKTSLGRLIPQSPSQQYGRPQQQQVPAARKDRFSHLEHPSGPRLNSPSSYSLATESSYVSNKTKESALSRNNLQDSSVLSFSSSEDEGEDASVTHKFSGHEIDSGDEHGDIIIGQAQAFEMRPSTKRTPSVGKLSMMSTETNAGTIEVMYTPETAAPPSFSFRGNSIHGSRRSSHVRHPSVIPEDDSYRPKTATNGPLSPSMYSVRSTRTSRSEPRPHQEHQQKMMAVTAEEEALLEMMRKKRAAMAKQSFSEGYISAIQNEEKRQKTPPESSKKTPRTSAFLAMESPGSSPVRLVETKSNRKTSNSNASPLLIPPRGWAAKAGSQDSSNGMTMLHDNSSYDTGSGSDHPTPSTLVTTIPHQLSPQPQFSPLDPFPSSPTQATSAPSPTTVSHASPLPSPITPGLRNGELDMKVKVASSEPSCSSDNDELIVLETGVIGAPQGSIKPDEATHHHHHNSHHQRRRTASSGADMNFPIPPALAPTAHDLAPVSEASSRAPSVIEPTSTTTPSQPHPKLPRKSSRRTPNTLAVSPSSNPTININNPKLPLRTTSTSSRQSSLISSTSHHSHSHSHSHSNSRSRTSSPAASTTGHHGHSHHHDRKRVVSRGSSITSIKRESVAVGTASTRCSVSEDVLAAWGSLGGLREYAKGG